VVHVHVVPSRTQAATDHWKVWLTFCDSLRTDPYLQESIAGFDGIPFLQVFEMQYRLGDMDFSGDDMMVLVEGNDSDYSPPNR
jgi:hypothetical protein